MTDLPDAWEWSTLGEVCDVVLGQSPPGSSYNVAGVGLPFFQGKTEFGSIYPTVRQWTTDPRKRALPGDVLVSVRAPVGPTNVASTECAIGRGLSALRSPVLNHSFLLWAIRSSEASLAEKATGTTFAAVTGAQLRAHRVPVAPKREQERIVTAIEEHLSRLDAAEWGLASSAKRVGSLDRSLLAIAQAEGPEVELGELLVDIEAGKSFKTPGRRAGPAEWGVIKVSAMTWGEFDSNENKAVPGDQRIDARYEIRPGDLLLSRANTSEYVGATVLVGECRSRLLLSDKSMRLHTRDGVDRRWLRFSLGSPGVRAQMSAIATGTSDSMRNISQAKVRALRLRVPSVESQRELAERIDAGLGYRRRLTGELSGARARSSALRRSILAAAFAGRLVPQDPSDEPASALLERIRAERAAAGPTKRTRKAKSA